MVKKEILDEFNGCIRQFKEKYSLDDYDLVDLILGKKTEVGYSIPVDVFNDKLGCLEAATKYFKENVDLSFKKIAELVGRSNAAIINSYAKAKLKFPESFIPKSDLLIPVEIFTNKRLSILENLVVYLKDERCFRFREIGKLIKRNEKTIWTVYNRVKKKI